MGFLPVNLEFWNYRHWEEYAESLLMSVQERKQRQRSALAKNLLIMASYIFLG